MGTLISVPVLSAMVRVFGISPYVSANHSAFSAFNLQMSKNTTFKVKLDLQIQVVSSPIKVVLPPNPTCFAPNQSRFAPKSKSFCPQIKVVSPPTRVVSKSVPNNRQQSLLTWKYLWNGINYSTLYPLGDAVVFLVQHQQSPFLCVLVAVGHCGAEPWHC